MKELHLFIIIIAFPLPNGLNEHCLLGIENEYSILSAILFLKFKMKGDSWCSQRSE